MDAIVGVDAEWTPSVLSGRPEQLALLQLAVKTQVYILDIPALKTVLPRAEWLTFTENFFCNPQVIKLG